jgi:hypothetical protein
MLRIYTLKIFGIELLRIERVELKTKADFKFSIS